MYLYFTHRFGVEVTIPCLVLGVSTKLMGLTSESTTKDDARDGVLSSSSSDFTGSGDALPLNKYYTEYLENQL